MKTYKVEDIETLFKRADELTDWDYPFIDSTYILMDFIRYG